MREDGGDEEEDGESEDDNEDSLDRQGTGGADKRTGTKRRKQHRFYFRTGTVVRTTTDNGRDVTDQCQV